MQKPVKSVIASARALIRRPSEAKLAGDDMRLLLHQILEELHTFCLKENADFMTHDLGITLTYDSSATGYSFTLDRPARTETDGDPVTVSVSSIIPVFLRFQELSDNPDTGQWRKVRLQRLTTFGEFGAPGEVQAAFIGNNWQNLTTPQFKLNLSPEFVSAQRWRTACRVFPNDIMDYDDMVPFPGEFTSLVEYMLAARSIPLVNDDSPAWQRFSASQVQQMMLREQNGKLALKEWLNKDVENHVLTLQSYDYRSRNAQLGTIVRRPRVQW